MKYPRYEKEIEALIRQKGIVTVEDFKAVLGGVPMTSVYARIRGLVQGGTLSVVGKGRYSARRQMPYKAEVTPWMRACADVMKSELVGVNSCITERNGNLEVEVDKADIARTVEVLRRHFEKVVYRRDAKLLVEVPVGFVLVGRLVSEAPLLVEDGIGVSSAEKALVDAVCRKEDPADLFQRMLEVYPINQDRLRRYAARRGVAEEVEAFLKQAIIYHI